MVQMSPRGHDLRLSCPALQGFQGVPSPTELPRMPGCQDARYHSPCLSAPKVEDATYQDPVAYRASRMARRRGRSVVETFASQESTCLPAYSTTHEAYLSHHVWQRRQSDHDLASSGTMIMLVTGQPRLQPILLLQVSLVGPCPTVCLCKCWLQVDATCAVSINPHRPSPNIYRVRPLPPLSCVCCTAVSSSKILPLGTFPSTFSARGLEQPRYPLSFAGASSSWGRLGIRCESYPSSRSIDISAT